jgi:hypothetical protein
MDDLEDGFLEPETCSHPQIVHLIKLFELCLADSFITIIPVNLTTFICRLS